MTHEFDRPDEIVTITSLFEEMTRQTKGRPDRTKARRNPPRRNRDLTSLTTTISAICASAGK